LAHPLNIAVMLGGPSAEREVSLRSGRGVVNALRSLGHVVTEVDPKDETFALPAETQVVFLALHGTFGEDGTVQRKLEDLGVPYTGCDPEASRIGFDKILTKERFAAAGVSTARFAVLDTSSTSWPMGWDPPVVLKPARQGSSVGLQFVERVVDWSRALAETLRYDSTVLMEEKIAGRETTVGILEGKALPVVEIRTNTGIND
jgi:D-alanine-D-alanine ligase